VLTLAAWLVPVMGAVWYGAVTGWGAAFWLRWVVVGPALALAWIALLVAPRRTRLPRVVLPLVLLVAYGLGVSVASKSSDLAFWKATAFGVTSMAALVCGAVLVERFGRDRVLVLWRWCWRAFLVFSLLALATGHWQRDSAGLAGPSNNPNMYAALVVTFGLVLLNVHPGQRVGWLYVLESGAAVALLFATRSRASMAGAAAAVVLAVVLGRRARRWWIAGGIGLACALALLLTPEVTVRGMEDVLEVSGGRSVFETRAATWEASWDAMLAGLPFGFGWGVKEVTAREWSMDAVSTGYGREEGTSWLPIGEELGLPGFVFWAWIWWALFRCALTAPDRVRPLAVGALGYYFVLATFEGWLLSPGSWECWAFWLTIGILLARPRRVVHPIPPAPGLRRPVGAAA
jgi:hypothetical protein